MGDIHVCCIYEYIDYRFGVTIQLLVCLLSQYITPYRLFVSDYRHTKLEIRGRYFGSIDVFWYALENTPLILNFSFLENLTKNDRYDSEMAQVIIVRHRSGQSST